jgi:hypothetical protein
MRVEQHAQRVAAWEVAPRGQRERFHQEVTAIEVSDGEVPVVVGDLHVGLRDLPGVSIRGHEHRVRRCAGLVGRDGDWDQVLWRGAGGGTLVEHQHGRRQVLVAEPAVAVVARALRAECLLQAHVVCDEDAVRRNGGREGGRCARGSLEHGVRERRHLRRELGRAGDAGDHRRAGASHAPECEVAVVSVVARLRWGAVVEAGDHVEGLERPRAAASIEVLHEGPLHRAVHRRSEHQRQMTQRPGWAVDLVEDGEALRRRDGADGVLLAVAIAVPEARHPRLELSEQRERGVLGECGRGHPAADPSRRRVRVSPLWKGALDTVHLRASTPTMARHHAVSCMTLVGFARRRAVAPTSALH